MPINDGRTRHVAIVEQGHQILSCWYRPATSSERLQLQTMLARLVNHRAEDFTFSWMEQHFVMLSMPDHTSLRQWSEMYPSGCEQLFHVMQGVAKDSSGQIWLTLEDEWKQNLKDGIHLLRTRPDLANRSCRDCETFWYSEKTGKILLVNSTGEKRLREGLTPCRTEFGCPKGTPENQKSLNKENRRCLRHYLECDATNTWPDDQIVRENAALIKRELQRKLK